MPHDEERGSSAGESVGADEDDDGRSVDVPDSLLVVSNRQPYRHEFVDDPAARTDADVDAVVDGEPVSVDEPTGGLTAGLDPVLREAGGTWIAWGDGDADRAVTDEADRVSVPPDAGEYTLRRVWLPEDAVDGYYYGFSNRVLWPLCHGFPDLVDERENDREWYRWANRRFAEAVVEEVDDPADAVVWLQDYHFGFAPATIREGLGEGVTLAQFWHVAWPSPAAYRACPVRRDLLEGLLGNDLLGFHVDRYREAFLRCVDRYLPAASVDRRRSVVRYDGRETRVTAAPMGVDAASYRRTARDLDDDRWRSIRDRYDVPADVTIGLGLDRLDYAKGIPERFRAVERLLERRPGWRGEFTFVQKATPSRTEIPAYEWYGERVRDEVERINARFATRRWAPIVYTEDKLPREALCALYRRADAMVVSSLRDGMNLVAQEYVAATADGADDALVLSRRAGAHDVLGEHAYTIDPERTDEFAATLERALSDPPDERRRRMDALQRTVFEHDLDAWMRAQFEAIDRVRTPSRLERPETGTRSGPR